MELKNQVVSLELAKKLKELGVKQESYFYWIEPNVGEYKVVSCHNIDKAACDRELREYWSAFTVAELGEMLPPFIKAEGYGYINLRMGKMDDGRYEVQYINRDGPIWTDIARNEADARASMVSFLLENKLT